MMVAREYGYNMEFWPSHGLESVNDCPLCNSPKRDMLHQGLRDHIFFCAPGKWNLYRCNECGCGYLDPRPTSATLSIAYRNYYTHTVPPSFDVRSLGWLRRIRYMLGNGYRNWRFGTKLHPASRWGVVVAYLMPKLRLAVEQEFRNLPRPMPGGRLLDVGFGGGAFLDLARSAGWHVAGVDIDPVAVESAKRRGLDVREGGIDAFQDRLKSFDLITLSHVLEHVYDPRGVLKNAYRLLKPGGKIWIETPNIDSVGHKRHGFNWRGLEPPRHLVLFNWDILDLMLEKEGFRGTTHLTRYDVYSRLAIQSNAIKRGLNPREQHQLGLAFRIENVLLGLKAHLNYRHSEYVTLQAFKPEEARDNDHLKRQGNS